MIESIKLISNIKIEKYEFGNNRNYKTIIDCYDFINSNNLKSFDIEIIFSSEIFLFRNHDYTWVDVNSDRIASEFAPKIIKLNNGFLVQSNITSGIWEFSKKNKRKLLWRFNPEFSNSLTFYSGKNNRKKIVDANSELIFEVQPALLFSEKNGIEISRSKIPFSAIACFTDHCDYDTIENIRLQREFFKTINLKVTKGFFMNHFSKREENVSFEKHAEEFELWKNDGHELCYHSLSQSIKSFDKSMSDFEFFNPPFSDISVWIDHGFQPYNFSLYKNNAIEEDYFEELISSKKIITLWNYIDAGTATKGIINQLNPYQFTLTNYLKGIKSYPVQKRLLMLFKNIIFHYDNHEKRVRNYIDAVADIKSVLKKRKLVSLFNFIKNIIPLIPVVFRLAILWKKEKNKSYKLAQYSSLVFRHKIKNKTFHIFQTIEMVDFKKALGRENVDLFIKESGVFIAHTYFSVDMKHYSGKLFRSEKVLDDEVSSNFIYFTDKIKENKIWNPTLTQLIIHLDLFKKTVFDINDSGNIFIKNKSDLSYRDII